MKAVSVCRCSSTGRDAPRPRRCVTHLSQLAAFGDRHYRVRKQVVGERTLTQVKALDEQERVAELALMNGSTSETNIHSAFETLTRAQERQREIS